MACCGEWSNGPLLFPLRLDDLPLEGPESEPLRLAIWVLSSVSRVAEIELNRRGRVGQLSHFEASRL